MTRTADVLVIGAGMAGVSAAARLAPSARVAVLEMEERPAYHTTGRSAATFILNYGNAVLRVLVERGQVDHRFVESTTDGWPELHAHLERLDLAATCRAAGLTEDQVRAFALREELFEDEALAKILKLYPTPQTLKAAVDSDSVVYQNALKAAGVDINLKEDPVKTTLLNYYEKLSLLDVASELGVSQSEVLGLLRVSPFREDWAVLTFPGGTILREQFNKLYGIAKEATRRGLVYLPPTAGDFFVTTTCMQANPLLMDACVIPLAPPAEEGAEEEPAQ